MAHRVTEHMGGTILLQMFFKLRPRQLLTSGTYDVGVTMVQLSPHNNTHCCQKAEGTEELTALLSPERLWGQRACLQQRHTNSSSTQHSALIPFGW